MHTRHADVHDVGLVEDCPGCAELAEKPFATLDDAMLRRMIEQAIPRNREFPESDTEARAVAQVLNTLEQCGKMAEVAPDLLEWYLRERWNIECVITGSATRRRYGL